MAGQRLAELDRAGLTDDTIVFYYGDHGSGMSRSKRWPYNLGTLCTYGGVLPKKWKHLAGNISRGGPAIDWLIS